MEHDYYTFILNQKCSSSKFVSIQLVSKGPAKTQKSRIVRNKRLPIGLTLCAQCAHYLFEVQAVVIVYLISYKMSQVAKTDEVCSNLYFHRTINNNTERQRAKYRCYEPLAAKSPVKSASGMESTAPSVSVFQIGIKRTPFLPTPLSSQSRRQILTT